MNPLEEEPHPVHLHRRQFLALGSAGLIAPFFRDLAWAEPLAREAVVRPMSIGYIEESETFRSLRRLPRKVRRPLVAVNGDVEEAEGSPVIVPAASLFQGNANLPGRPLRIHIHGLYPAATLKLERPEDLPEAVDLEVLFPSPDPAFPQPLPFFAWSFRKKPGWSPSPPVSFRYPLEWEAMPQFILRVRTAAGESIVLRTKFTVDAESGRPRLRRGAYLFGFNPGTWDRGGAKIADLARRIPAEMISLMVSMDPEKEE
jgi:hypothetical protein